MNINPHTIRVVNLALLLACLLVGFNAQDMTKANAQTQCSYPALVSDPIKFSWPPNTHVTVVIDDSWNESDRGAFESGIKME